MDVLELKALVNTVAADEEMPCGLRIELLEEWVEKLYADMFSTVHSREELEGILSTVVAAEDHVTTLRENQDEPQ